MFRQEASDYFKTLQDRICKGLEELDGKAKFSEDNWKRGEGGGGRTRVLQDGKVFEKGGVNFSAVEGELPERAAREILQTENSKKQKTWFYATGVSIVIHPSSPMVPIIHMNVRYFEADDKWWFGGGIDLTPVYVVEEDAKYFHSELKVICDRFRPDYYPEFKQWADDYFFIRHRGETRGIGGIFFDRVSGKGQTERQNIFSFVQAVGECFVPVYSLLVNKNKALPFGEKEKQWQLLRRGRYVEFNLVYDRGTKFGLETGGRAESILMSLPKNASWIYNHVPEHGSREEATLDLLRKGVDWVSS